MPGDFLRFRRLMQSCSSSAVMEAFKQDASAARTESPAALPDVTNICFTTSCDGACVDSSGLEAVYYFGTTYTGGRVALACSPTSPPDCCCQCQCLRPSALVADINTAQLQPD
ncbi:hypothetical protein ABBQ32_012111 [Trebouxia sp. C0010 RCD-2024]